MVLHDAAAGGQHQHHVRRTRLRPLPEFRGGLRAGSRRRSGNVDGGFVGLRRRSAVGDGGHGRWGSLAIPHIERGVGDWWGRRNGRERHSNRKDARAARRGAGPDRQPVRRDHRGREPGRHGDVRRGHISSFEHGLDAEREPRNLIGGLAERRAWSHVVRRRWRFRTGYRSRHGRVHGLHR